MQNSDTGIDTIFNVSMHRVSQCIAIINEFNMTYILIILKVQVRLKNKVGLFYKNIYFYTI